MIVAQQDIPVETEQLLRLAIFRLTDGHLDPVDVRVLGDVAGLVARRDKLCLPAGHGRWVWQRPNLRHVVDGIHIAKGGHRYAEDFKLFHER